MANPTPPSPTIVNSTTLSAIRTKVRRLTRTPSEAQLSTTELDNYINTFVVYDFPEHLRTFNLRRPFSFVCNPGQDIYTTDKASFGGVTTNQLYNFQNKYITLQPPFYVAGYQVFYTQSREQLYGIYPITNSIASIGTTGNGVATSFAGTINSQQSIIPPGLTQQIALIQNNVLFSSVAVNGAGLALADVPVLNPLTGNPTNVGNLYDPSSVAYATAKEVPPTVVDATNTINYLTGVFTITFNGAPAAGVPINSQTIPSVLSRPQAVMFYNNQFTLRPVPDQPYTINFEVFQRPTALLDAAQSPELEEYWQYIAYGAAKKIFEDRMDMDSVALIMPEYKMQERLVLRRTIVQQTNQRTASIYTENFGGQYGPGWFSGGGNF